MSGGEGRVCGTCTEQIFNKETQCSDWTMGCLAFVTVNFFLGYESSGEWKQVIFEVIALYSLLEAWRRVGNLRMTWRTFRCKVGKRLMSKNYLNY